MRTYLQLTFFILIASSLLGQVSFSDDFEGYNVGDLIASSSSDWELWPSAQAVDAAITDEQASGGANSLMLPGGQEIDIILPFGQDFTEGTFNLSFDVFIPTGANAYFNFQGNSDIAGPTGLWVLQCYLRSTGIFEVDNAEALVIQNAYPQNEWINITLDVNLTENLWKMFINGECLGSFTNTEERNRIYALNLYPDDGNAMSFVDNVKYTHTSDAVPVDIQVDAAYAGGVDLDAGVGVSQATFYGLSGTDQGIQINVANAGVQDITSGTITIDTDNQSISQEITETIPAGSTGVVTIEERIMIENGDQFAQVNLTNINGVADDNTCNNSAPMLFRGFTPAPNKKVFVEESTGVGCPWCPRGAVYMDYMQEKYPDHFVGIASHDNDQGPDPMTVDEWNVGMAPLTGNPSVWVDRVENTIINPQNVEGPFAASIAVEPLVTLDHGAAFNEGTRELQMNVLSTFTLVAIKSGTKLLVGLTEDGVTGPSPAYDQTNNYSGGNAGPMAGYENLPSVIPGLEFNHVMRLPVTPGLGMDDAYVDTDGLRMNHVFNVTLQDDWNLEKMHIVSAFLRADGTVENCNSTSIQEAIDNGVLSAIDPYLDNGISVFPNPTSGIANITLDFDKPTDLIMELTDAMGRSVTKENYGTVSGKQTVSFDGSTMEAGIYYMSFRSGNESTIKRLVITE